MVTNIILVYTSGACTCICIYTHHNIGYMAISIFSIRHHDAGIYCGPALMKVPMLLPDRWDGKFTSVEADFYNVTGCYQPHTSEPHTRTKLSKSMYIGHSTICNRTPKWTKDVYIHICTYVYVICICTYTYIYKSLSLYIYMYIYIYIRICIDIPTYIYIDRYMNRIQGYI